MVKRILDHSESLLFYDGPQLFIAVDRLGTKYVCLLVEESEDIDKYLCVAISNSRVESLALGELDLRTIYESPEMDELFVAESKPEEVTRLQATPIAISDVPKDWFPDAGFFLSIEKPSGVQVVEEARTRRRAIIQCRLNPPESRGEPKITAEHLSQAVKLIQRVVKHAYGKALRGMDQSAKEMIAALKNYELEVFAFSPGSFTVHLQSSIPADLFGHVEVSRALEIIDSISERIDDPDEAVKIVAQFGGRFATAYKHLLEFITKTETAIEYEWSMPERRTSTRYRITTVQAEPLYEEIIKRVGIEIEERKLIGRLTKVDEKYENWRLVSEADEREYTGRSEIDLAGLIIETQRYEFVCEERLEEEKGTGREITKLYLKSYKAL
ncbi:MAG: hypothetical protein KAX39_01535 [candidate division Zixibacteria bacterium]|nr:hypothetical protein [candidate division Zixibacteria bacterium]